MYTRKPTGTSEGVYQKLKAQILHLKLLPGSAISEIDTAAKYEISRTPVRDAFKMLESEGLLEIKPHVGTFVSLIDLNMISDILYMRDVLEQAILKDLSLSYDKSQEFKIQLLLQKQWDLIHSDIPVEELNRVFIMNDNEFHQMLYGLVGKKNVMSLFYSINSQYERFRTFLTLGGKEALQKLYQEHENIWKYISSKDLDSLSGVISHHIYDGFNSSAELVNQHPEFFRPMT